MGTCGKSVKQKVNLTDECAVPEKLCGSEQMELKISG